MSSGDAAFQWYARGEEEEDASGCEHLMTSDEREAEYPELRDLPMCFHAPGDNPNAVFDERTGEVLRVSEEAKVCDKVGGADEASFVYYKQFFISSYPLQYAWLQDFPCPPQPKGCA